MQPDTGLAAAYSRLLELGAILSADGHHEASYHALMAAVHCAADAADAARLGEVAGLLRAQKQAIDAIKPAHKLSTQLTHGGRSIFEMGAYQADAIAQRLGNQHRMEELRHRTRPAPPGG